MHEDSLPPQDPAPNPNFVESNRSFPLSFTGESGEFFRIWIVNMFLTLVTLGFYTPWARVRTRRYFHAHTHLDGHSFDYLAKPINILWGYLIVLIVVGGYYVAGFFNPFFTLPFAFLFIVAGPWVMYKAIRFKAHNTSYRNVRFQFHGTVGDAYAIYLGMAILIPFTFGLIVPYWFMKQREYFYSNLSFGGRRFDFTPEASEYYMRYIIAGVLGALLYFGIFLLFSVMMFAGSPLSEGPGAEGPGIWEILVIYLSMAPILLGFVFVQVYVYVSLFNYNLSRLLVQQSGFASTLKLGRYYWITVTNVIATTASLGLLTPWAMVRKTRYLADSVSVLHPADDLGDFVAGRGDEVSAIGDAAADVFEFDIGW